jgi:hypothetical protein
MNKIQITIYQAGDARFVHIIAIREMYDSIEEAKIDIERAVQDYIKNNVGGYNRFEQAGNILSVLLAYNM